MKLRTVILAFAAAAIATTATAQDALVPANPGGHHHYQLIDLGTLGGTQSTVFGLVQNINPSGSVQGIAETNLPDPDYPNPNPYIWINYQGYPDPLIIHAFQWQDGVLNDLGALPGGYSSTPTWINSAGDVVGGSTNGQQDTLAGVPMMHAVLWKHGHVADLGTLGGNESEAYSVSDRGQVTGFALNNVPDPFSIGGLANGSTYFGYGFFGTQSHAFLWDHGVMKDLGTLGGTDSVGFYINQRGDVAGQSFINDVVNPGTGIPTMDAFLWTNGKMIDLGNLGGTLSFVNDLNNRGAVVGVGSLTGDSVFHPFLWDGRKLHDLGTFGGTDGQAIWLNDLGEAVGTANLAGNQANHAFLWKNGAMSDLGTITGYPWSVAEGINNQEQVVGQCAIYVNGNFVAGVGCLWEKQGAAVDLNTLVVSGATLSVQEAFQINERGEITANGILANGDTHAVLLVPCDDDHANLAGCDYSMVDASVSQNSNSEHRSVAVTPPTKSSPTQTLNQLRNRWMQPYRLPGRPTVPRG